MPKRRSQPPAGTLQCFPSEINDETWMGLHRSDGVRWRYLYEIRTEQCPIVRSDLKNLTVKIARAYITKNALSVNELPLLIQNIHAALIDNTGTSSKKCPDERTKPAFPIKKSITPSAIFSLEDGRPYKTLKRHLARRGITPEAYRAKWNLPADYPMVAPEYSKRRSELATATRLGRKKAAVAGVVDKMGRPRRS